MIFQFNSVGEFLWYLCRGIAWTCFWTIIVAAIILAWGGG